MVRIERVRQDVYDPSEGTHTAVVDIQVSTAEELPDAGSTIGNLTIGAGSIAQVIQTGKWYTLDEDESWYDEDGNEVS